MDSSWTRLDSAASCDLQLALYCFSDSLSSTKPDETNVCEQESCAEDSELATTCETFLDDCLTVEEAAECVEGAALIGRDMAN